MNDNDGDKMTSLIIVKTGCFTKEPEEIISSSFEEVLGSVEKL